METTPDELWSPDAVDQYNLVPNLAAMQDTVQDAISSLRALIRTRTGTDADRIAAAASSVLGDVWVTTDTSPKRRYFSTGGAWSLDYIPRTNWTPTWTNFIPGSSTLNFAHYGVSGGYLNGDISLTIGAGFTMSSLAISFAPPIATVLTGSSHPVGTCIFLNAGTGWFSGPLMLSGGKLQLMADMGSFISGVNGTGTPFGWDSSAGDEMHITFRVPV